MTAIDWQESSVAVCFLRNRVVGTARSAAEALSLADRARPEIALMDINLHGPGDGILAADALSREGSPAGQRRVGRVDPAWQGGLPQVVVGMPRGDVAEPAQAAAFPMVWRLEEGAQSLLNPDLSLDKRDSDALMSRKPAGGELPLARRLMCINRPGCASTDDVRTFTFSGALAMKILLAVDGSASTKRMLATLAAHDEMLRGDNQYTALTVLPLIPPHAAAFMSRASIDGWYREEAEKVLTPVQAFGKQNAWALDVCHVGGHAGDEIVALCDKGSFDLIVMGTHGHSALGNVVMGSTATRVLARSKKPVLLIP